MAATIPPLEPTEHQCGDTLKFSKTLSAYPPSEGWNLSYALRGLAQNAFIADITAVPDGDGFLVNVPAADTAGWIPGSYWLTGFVSNGTDRFKVYQARLILKPDPAQANESGYDGRTYHERMLDKVREIIENGVIREVIRYSYNGIATEIVSMEDAFKAEAYLESKIAQEASAGKARRIKIRFVNPR